MKKFHSLFAIIVITLSLNSFARAITKDQLSIEVLQQERIFNFSQPARLSDALQSLNAQNVVVEYPLATTLFDESQQAKKKVSELKYSISYALINKDLASHPFYKFIQQQNFAERVISSIDIDEIRLYQKKNPLLSGSYSLTAPKRIKKIYYLGNLNSANALSGVYGISYNDQQAKLSRLLRKESLSPVFIYPDGKVVSPEISYWLNNQYFLPPMTIVYFPFESYETSQLDKNIVKLLTFLKI